MEHRIYLSQLETNDITYSTNSASYLDPNRQ